MLSFYLLFHVNLLIPVYYTSIQQKLFRIKLLDMFTIFFLINMGR